MDVDPSGLREELAASRADNRRLRGEIAALTERLDLEKESQARLQSKYDQLASNVNALSLGPLRNTERLFHEDKAKLLRRIEELEDELKITSQHNKNRGERLELLEKAANDKAVKSIVEDPSQLAHAAQELVNSKAREDIKDQSIKDLSRKLQASERHCEAVEDQLRKVTDRAKTLRSSLEEETTAHEKTRQEAEVAARESSERIAELETELKTYQDKCVLLRDDLDKARIKVEEAHRRMKYLTNEVALQTDKTGQAEAGLAYANDRIRELEGELSHAEDTIQEYKEREEEVLARQMEAEAVLHRTRAQREELKRLREKMKKTQHEAITLSRKNVMAATAKAAEGAARKDAEGRMRALQSRVAFYQSQLEQEVESRTKAEEELRRTKTEAFTLRRHVEKLNVKPSVNLSRTASGSQLAKSHRGGLSPLSSTSLTGKQRQAFASKTLSRTEYPAPEGEQQDLGTLLLATSFAADEDFDIDDHADSDEEEEALQNGRVDPDKGVSIGDLGLTQLRTDSMGYPGPVQVVAPKNDPASTRLLRVSRLNMWLRRMAAKYSGSLYTRETQGFMFSVARKLASLLWQRRVVEARAVTRLLLAERMTKEHDELRGQLEDEISILKNRCLTERRSRLSLAQELLGLRNSSLSEDLGALGMPGTVQSAAAALVETPEEDVDGSGYALQRLHVWQQYRGRVVSLRGCDLSDTDLKVLLPFLLNCSGMEELDLSENRLSANSTDSILQLCLALCPPGAVLLGAEVSLEAEAKSGERRCLRRISMRQNRLSTPAAQKLAVKLRDLPGCLHVHVTDSLQVSAYTRPLITEVRNGTALIIESQPVGPEIVMVDCQDQREHVPVRAASRGSRRKLLSASGRRPGSQISARSIGTGRSASPSMSSSRGATTPTTERGPVSPIAPRGGSKLKLSRSGSNKSGGKSAPLLSTK